VITFVILWLRGISMTEIDPSAAEALIKPYIWISSALEALLINVINIPVIIYALLKSGDWERQVIQIELADELGTVITPDEYAGAKAEKRFKLRQIPGYPRRVGRLIRDGQNSLAFHKHYLKRQGRDVNTDSLVQFWRAEIAQLRNSTSPKTSLTAH